MKKKKLAEALNAATQLCNIRERQIGELLTELEISRRAHMSMCGEWEKAEKEVERLSAALEMQKRGGETDKGSDHNQNA